MWCAGTSIYGANDAFPLTTMDGASVQLIAVFRRGKAPGLGGTDMDDDSGCCVAM
jgi:hypothetical protein